MSSRPGSRNDAIERDVKLAPFIRELRIVINKHMNGEVPYKVNVTEVLGVLCAVEFITISQKMEKEKGG